MGSRTFADTPNGTFGQSIPAAPQSAAFSDGRALLLQVASSDDPTTGFRTNVGLVNLGDDRADVTLKAKYSWEVLELTIPPHRQRQLNDVLRTLGAGTRDLDAVEVTVSRLGRVIPYASVVDNATGDPTFIPAQRIP